MDELNSVNREHIEKVADEFDGQPDPGWEQMEETVREVRAAGGESNHPVGDAPAADVGNDEIVSRSGDLTHPVGTESDSY